MVIFTLNYDFHALIQEYSTSYYQYEQSLSMGRVIFKLVPWFITIVFLLPILKELRKMARYQMPAGREQTRRATISLTIIFSIFSVYSLVDTAVSILTVMYKSDVMFLFHRVRNMIKVWYGITNTIIYDWRTKTYCQHILNSLSCTGNSRQTSAIERRRVH